MTRDAVAGHLVTELIRVAAAALAARGRFSLAVPGGSVAHAVLPRLAAAPIDWRAVDIFLTDDRDVAPESPESNEGLVRELLLQPLGPAAPALHSLIVPGVPLSDAAARAAHDLAAVLGTPPRLDLVLLGVGEDGHVASVFPGHPVVHETRPVSAVRGSPKPPPTRITLTLPAINTAEEVWLVAAGVDKAQPIGVAMAGSGPMQLPAAGVHGLSRTLWLLDRAAAADVKPSFRSLR